MSITVEHPVPGADQLGRNLAAARRAVRLLQGTDANTPIGALGFVPFTATVNGTDIAFAATGDGIAAIPAGAPDTGGVRVLYTDLDRHYDHSAYLRARVGAMLAGLPAASPAATPSAQGPAGTRLPAIPLQIPGPDAALAPGDPVAQAADRLADAVDRAELLIDTLPEPIQGLPPDAASRTQNTGLAHIARTVRAAALALGEEQPGEAWTHLTELWDITRQTWIDLRSSAPDTERGVFARNYARLVELTARAYEGIGRLAASIAHSISALGTHDSAAHRALLTLSSTARDAADDIRLVRESAPTPELDQIAVLARSDLQASRSRIAALGAEARAHVAQGREQLAEHGGDVRTSWSLRSTVERIATTLLDDGTSAARQRITQIRQGWERLGQAAERLAATARDEAGFVLRGPTTPADPALSEPLPAGQNPRQTSESAAADALPPPQTAAEGSAAASPVPDWPQREHGSLTDWRVREARDDALQLARSADQAADLARSIASPSPAEIEAAALALDPALAAAHKQLEAELAELRTADQQPWTTVASPSAEARAALTGEPGLATRWQDLLARIRENSAQHADPAAIQDMTQRADHARAQAAGYQAEITLRAGLDPARALAEATARAAALATFATAAIDATHSLTGEAQAPALRQDHAARAQA